MKNNKQYIMLLFLLTIIIYLPAFQGVWQYDDMSVIINNEETICNIFSFDFFRGVNKFRAIPMLTFAINYFFGKFNIFGYHLINLFIHLLSGVVLYFFILELLITFNQSKQSLLNKFKTKQIAFLTSLFWLLAPINVQAVTYIVQRMTSLAGLFYLITLLFYLKFRNYQFENNKFNYKYLTVLIFSLLFAFLSKQNSFLLIPTLLYIEWSFYRKANFGKIKQYFILFLITIVSLLTIIYLFFNSGTDSNIFAIFENNYGHREFSPLQRLFIEPSILLKYISLMIFPFVGRFHLLYSPDWLNAPAQIFPYLSFGLVLLTFIFSIKYAKKYKLISFGLFFFLINHLIESSIIGLQLVAEHRNYIPSIGVFFIIALTIEKLRSTLNRDKILNLFIIIFVLFSMLNTSLLNLKYKERYCSAIYDFKSEYNAQDHDVVSLACDRLMYDKNYKNAFHLLNIEYNNIISNPNRKKFFDNYVSHSTRLLRYYIFLYYINSEFNIELTLKFIENKFIYDNDEFWTKVENIENYNNIFSYFYVKSLLYKYQIIDNITYQNSILFDKKIIDKYFFFRKKHYNKFVNYIQDDIIKLKDIELSDNEKKVLVKINTKFIKKSLSENE